MESADEIRQALGDARLIFICAGLGGGTGSGAAPVIAEIARETGALVISFATMPFGFEGKRRMAQANEALVRLQEASERRHLLRERQDGRHRRAESRHSSGVRRGRCDDQPKRALDRQPDSAARADPHRLR